VLLSIVGASMLLEREQVLPAIAHVGATAPLMIAVYMVAMRNVYDFERRQPRDAESALPQRYKSLGLRAALLQFALFALIVAVMGSWLPVVAVRIAESMDWSRSFVGTLFVTIVTALPETVVTVSALRLGALDMAIANLLGSNLFNIVVVLSIDDLLHLPGPILAAVSPVHAVTAFSAAMMSGAVIIGLVYRPGRPWQRAPGVVSLALLTVYVINVYVLYIHGE